MNKNVPKLRFREFSDEWTTKKLGMLGVFFKGNGISKADLSEIGQECILYGQLYTTYGEVINKVKSKTDIKLNNPVYSKKNDVIIPSSGESAIDIATASCVQKDNILLGGDLNIFRGKKDNGIFLSYQLNNAKRKEISKIAQGASVVHVYNEQLKKVKVNLPSLHEQEKIADFFTILDSLIEEQDGKVKDLETYKKGMMQKVFSQEIRFKDENGCDYPEWEEIKLKQLFKERKLFSEKGREYSHVTLSKDGIYEKGERYDRDFLVRTDDKKYKVTLKDDICYNPANLKFGVICRNSYGKAIFSPIYITFEVLKGNSKFIEYFICRNDFINKVRKYEEGTVYERMAVKPEDFLRFNVQVPVLSEQNKIAEFLSNIDNLIEEEKKNLDDLREIKKGLLQQMFV